MSEAEAEWEPGDPLYASGSYTNYFFNFRPLNDTEDCACPDRAGSPVPVFGSHDLNRFPDELERFIAEYHTWKEQEGG